MVIVESSTMSLSSAGTDGICIGISSFLSSMMSSIFGDSVAGSVLAGALLFEEELAEAGNAEGFAGVSAPCPGACFPNWIFSENIGTFSSSLTADKRYLMGHVIFSLDISVQCHGS